MSKLALIPFVIATTATCVTCVSAAHGGAIALSCKVRQSDRADDRIRTTDRIVIDLANKKVDMRSSAIGDWWSFENLGVNEKLGWYDQIAIHQFDDGMILAGGIRAKAVFGFNYNPQIGQLVYTFTDYGNPGYVIFNCTPLRL